VNNIANNSDNFFISGSSPKAERRGSSGAEFIGDLVQPLAVPLALSLFRGHPHDAGVFLQILVMRCNVADISVIPFDCLFF